MRYPLACGFMGLLQTDTKKRPLSGRFERENALSRIFVGYYSTCSMYRAHGLMDSVDVRGLKQGPVRLATAHLPPVDEPQ